MAKPMNAYTKGEVLAAITNSFGVMARVAEKLECDAHKAKRYVYLWDDTLKYFHEEKNHKIDACNKNIMDNVEAGDFAAAKWLLSKLDPKTYGDKIEVDSSMNIKITFDTDEETQDEINKLLDN